MKSGIAPSLLHAQVKSTADWLWSDDRARAVTAILDGGRDAQSGDLDGTSYLRFLLAAHFATVATFVPTDVDARIRHHAWAAMETEAEIAAACDVVDEIAACDVRWVSARVDESPRGTLSGHDGEWLGVRAGALGRAAALGAKDLAARLGEQIAQELDREAAIFEDAIRQKAPAARVLSIATIIAHNLGDLSRVVEAWPGHASHAELTDHRARFARLGHPDAREPRRAFLAAGALNKAIMAGENHRFLALRKARALRGSRALLLPIGPWFDAWGETVAKTLEERDRADVVAALLELHLTSPAQLGCLRALAGIHVATRGGLEVHVPSLPARIRKEALRGRVREALDVTPRHFEARMERRYEAERERIAPWIGGAGEMR